jgi:hypothetical protein
MRWRGRSLRRRITDLDDTATLALLLDRVVDGREVCPEAETTVAILEGPGDSPTLIWRRSRWRPSFETTRP